MSWRRQLPAYSPLPFRAVVAGLRGLWSKGETARRSLEAALTHDFGASAALLTDSGTSALQLAIRVCLEGSPGAAVAMPAYACYDLATAADGAGAPVVLYDVDPTTLAPDLASLRRAVEQGARAIVLVHLYGIPVDPEPVRAAAGTRVLLIEDAAQGAGASLRGRPLGSFGDLAVLSFGRGKGMTAGRGGALLGRGEPGRELLTRARGLVLPAARGAKEAVQLLAQWLLGRPWLYAIPASVPFLRLGDTVYHAPARPRGLSAVGASALSVTRSLAAPEAAVRRARGRRLLARVGRAGRAVAIGPGAEPGYLRLPIAAAPKVRARAEAPRARALGIMPGYPLALCDLPGFAARVLQTGERFEGARAAAASLVTLPVHSLLNDADLAALEGWLDEAGD